MSNENYVDFKKETGGNLPLLENLPEGWTEYKKPIMHGSGGSRMRRFFKNKEGFTVWIEERFPTCIFSTKAVVLTMCCDYVLPNGKCPVCFYEGETEEDFGAEPGSCFDVKRESDFPVDKEMQDVLGEDRAGFENSIQALYTSWCVYTVVKDEEHAFAIADLMSKRFYKKDGGKT